MFSAKREMVGVAPLTLSSLLYLSLLSLTSLLPTSLLPPSPPSPPSPVGIPPHQQQCKHMQWNQVDDEHISSPRRHLVRGVREGSEGGE